MKTLVILLPAVLILTACGQSDGANLTITGENGSAGVVNGIATVDLPGMRGRLTLPKLQFDDENLDLDGVKLFPGSTVSNVAVNANAGADKVRIAFESPATLDRVRAHFRKQLDQAGFEVSDDGHNLSGKSADGEPFRLTLEAAGPDRAKGELALGR